MIRTLTAITVSLAFLLPSGAATAQDSDKWVLEGWEISPFIGVFDDQPEFDPGGSSAVFTDPARNIFFGAHLGYHFPSGFFVDVEGGYFPVDMRLTTGAVVDLDLVLYGAGLGYNIPLSDKVQVYGVAGLGAARWSPENLDSETDLTLSYGAGLRFSLTKNFALRAEGRMHQIPDALAGTAMTLAGSAQPSETFWGWGLTLGASFFLGGSRDSDGDGVDDDSDACPNTPMGAQVDARGCALDTDGDGVADHSDQCPDTPRGATVDGSGCPNDGDNDGVLDGLDRCPDTREGAQVDENGCALDGDGDGVPDGIDRCPTTPPGSEVDEAGCTVVQEEPEEEAEDVTFDNVNFAHDSSELESAASAILQGVGTALSSLPDARIQLVGHTDSTGTEVYNTGLSMARAQAVLDYLLANFSGLDASAFDLSGEGETQPIASNSADAGRRQNRRVEITLAGGQ